MTVGLKKRILGVVLIAIFVVLDVAHICYAESYSNASDDVKLGSELKENHSYEATLENDYDYEAAIRQDKYNQEIINSKPLYEIAYDGKLQKVDNGMNKAEAIFAAVVNKATGTYPRGKNSKGTILYTKDTAHKVARVVGHAAIVYDNNAKNSKVIEATSKGVVKGNNNWDNKKHCRAAVVSSLSVAKRAKVANKCATWVGKPYNWHFADVETRKSFYCSHLVWAGYIDSYNVNLDDNHKDPTQKNFLIVYPSELIASKKTSVTYKKG